MEINFDLVLEVGLGVFVGQAVFAALATAITGFLAKRAAAKAKVDVENLMAKFRERFPAEGE